MEKFLSEQPMAYHFHGGAKHMIHFQPSELPQALQFQRNTNSTLSPSHFNTLPLEITHQIISHLDLKSLLSCKNVSYMILALVNSLPAFRDVITHAPGALRAFAASRLLSYFTVIQVSNVLHSDRCVNCKNFGPYIFLPTCERCCYPCLYDYRVLRFRVLTPSKAQKDFGVSASEIRRVPKMTLVSGTYSEMGRTFQRRVQLVSLSALQSLNRAIGLDPLDDRVYDRFPFTASTSMPFLDSGSKIVQSGIWCRGCEDDWYRSCAGLQYENDYRNVDDHDHLCSTYRAFQMDEFLLHRDVCTGTRRLECLYDAGKDDSTIEWRRNTLVRQ